MSLCEFSGVGPVAKNLVSHSNIKTKSRAHPNVHKKDFYSPSLKRKFRAKVSTRALRDIDKLGGVDIYILKQKNENLSPRLLKVKNRLLNKMNKIQNKEMKNEIKN